MYNKNIILSDFNERLKGRFCMIGKKLFGGMLCITCLLFGTSAALAADEESVENPAVSQVVAAQSIQGESVATLNQMRALAWKHNHLAPDLAPYYLKMGEKYGIRGDVAFCQAALETNWWRYDGLVRARQYNYSNLGKLYEKAIPNENINGANHYCVWYMVGDNGASFATPEDGVEAQFQHLYGALTNDPLPAGFYLKDSGFNEMERGTAVNWDDLEPIGPCELTEDMSYGETIVQDFYAEMLQLKK